jgi:hypothetical protein
MSKWVIRGHFGHLRFKSFPLIWRTHQGEEIWPLKLSSEFSGVPEDSIFPLLGMQVAFSHLAPKWGCDKIVVSTRETWGPYDNLCLEANVTGCWYLWGCLCLLRYSSQYAPRNDHWLRWHELRHGLDIVPSAGWNLIRCCKFRQHHYGLFMYTGCYYRQLILNHFCSSLHVITITPTSCRVANGPIHLSSTI